MRNDLLFAVFVAIVINLAIWIVGAEILQPNGIEVKTLGDPGKALELFFGPIGWYIFFVGVFATFVRQHEIPQSAARVDSQGQRALGTTCTEQTAREIDLGIRGLLKDAYARARTLLEQRRADLDTGARLLLARETITPEEFPALLPVAKEPATYNLVDAAK